MHIRCGFILLSGLIGIVCAGGNSIAPPLHAADIKVLDQTYEGLSAITVTGEMVLADGEAFSEAASTVGHAIVVFSSPGGSLFAGLQIGQLIQLHHFATVVLQGDYCASACAFAWLSGSPRMMEDGGQVGFHAAYVEEGGAKVESGVGNALVGAYLNNLGMSAQTIIYIEMAQPDQITWLTQEDAQRLGLAVKFFAPPDGGPSEPDDRPNPVTPPVPSNRPETPEHRVESILLPELTAPLPQPPVPAASVEAHARSFVSTYFAQWSEANDHALAYFDATYGPSVIFYGNRIDHDSLMASKQRYAQRWPNRIYNARAETLAIFCNDVSQVCTVSGVVDWVCKSLVRNITSDGSANFRLTVSFSKPAPVILAESGSVINRSIH